MIPLSQLAVGDFLKEGGQGKVFELADRKLLLKRYKPGVTVDPDGLRSLVEWRRQLPLKDLTVLDKLTAWPIDVVDCEDGTFGIVMPRAGDQFWHVVEGDQLPRDLSWAFMVDAARYVGLRPATSRTAVNLVHLLAVLLDVMHRNGAVYGDLSAANVLWSGGFRPSIFVIDCDAASVNGRPRALAEAQTPLWSCPWVGVDGRERDEYKLAVAFLRLYFRYEGPLTDTTHNIQIPAGIPVTKDAAELLESGLGEFRLNRPTAADWIDTLRNLEQGLKVKRIA